MNFLKIPPNSYLHATVRTYVRVLDLSQALCYSTRSPSRTLRSAGRASACHH